MSDIIARGMAVTAKNAARIAQTKADQAYELAGEKAVTFVYNTIEDLVTAINAGIDGHVGDSIYVKDRQVPDFWICGESQESVQYIYTTDAAFIEATLTQQTVGYFIITQLEAKHLQLGTTAGTAYEGSAGAALEQEVAGKQDIIEDLDTIRIGAALGATALQQHQDISGKQDVISDLENIRTGAAAGATALQSGDNVSSLINDAGYLTQHQSLKTVNGEVVTGSGNIVIPTYTPFKSSWRHDTINHLIADINNDSDAIVGKSYLGEIDTVTAAEGLFNGNAEIVVNIMNGTTPYKVIWCIVSSNNTDPYHWEATFSSGSISPKGWTPFVPGTRTIAGVDLKDNITVAELQTALNDSTHRFVTDSEKAIWDGKQDIINDLSDIRSGAALGATALQSHQDISGKQDVLTFADTSDILSLFSTNEPVLSLLPLSNGMLLNAGDKIVINFESPYLSDFVNVIEGLNYEYVEETEYEEEDPDTGEINYYTNPAYYEPYQLAIADNSFQMRGNRFEDGYEDYRFECYSIGTNPDNGGREVMSEVYIYTFEGETHIRAYNASDNKVVLAENCTLSLNQNIDWTAEWNGNLIAVERA